MKAGLALARGMARRDPVDWFVRRAGLARFTTFGCALGLALSALAGPRPALALGGLSAALIVTLCATALRHASPRSKPAGRFAGRLALVAGVVLVGLTSGYLLGSIRVAGLVHSDLEGLIGERVTAQVIVTGSVRSNSGWQSATATVVRLGGVPVSGGPAGEKIMLEVPPAEGRREAVPFSQGAILELEGRIEAPSGPAASGYDQARTLLHQGIKVVLSADAAGGIAVVGYRGGAAGWFDRLRASALEHLSRGPAARVDEVLQGVVVGDTTGIDEDWLTAFRRSGTAHMLSVSGLHVASLAAIMMGMARLLRAPRWAGFLAAAAAAALLVPFVGPSPPVVRSAVMIGVVLFGRWVGRGKDQWQVLALAAVVVLAVNPFGIFDVGFQLSFAAFVGMLLLLGPLERLLRRLPRSVGSNVAVSLAASIGTAPVALLVFGKTSLVSPLANLLVVPTLPLVTGLGMASVFAGFAWSGLSTALDALASVPMTWTVLVSRLMALFPVLDAADLGRAAVAAVAGAAVSPFALASVGLGVRVPFDFPLPYFRRTTRWTRARRPRNRRLGFAVAAAIVTLGMTAGYGAYPVVAAVADAARVAAGGQGWPSEIEVRVLDVGQGTAVLVRTPQHHAALFDGGPGGCDLGGQLHALGVDELQLVVISHPHADHFAGLLEALDDVRVDTLVDHVQVTLATGEEADSHAGAGGSAAPGDAGDYLEMRGLLAEAGCAYSLVSDGCSATLDGLTVRFFAPSLPLVLYEGSSPWGRAGAPTGDELNAASLVAVASAAGIDVLLPGDAEAAALDRYDLPPTDVLVVPHHGSRGAVSAQQLGEWGTQTALVSVGAGNSFGHPDPATLALLEHAVAHVVRTDTAGWVSCTVKGDGMTMKAQHLAKNTAAGQDAP